MGIPRAIVPIHPGQFSAYGFIMTNARVDRQRTTQLISTRFDAGARQRDHGRRWSRTPSAELAAQGYSATSRSCRALEMRYLGQNYELELPVTDDTLADARDRAAVAGCSTTAHEARFGFAIPGEIIEIVNYTMTVLVAHRQAGPAADRAGRRAAERDRRAPGLLHRPGVATTPVYRARRAASRPCAARGRR